MIINHFVYNWRYNEFKILIEFSDDSRELVKQYNKTHHRIIKMASIQVKSSNEKALLQSDYNHLKIFRRQNFLVCDHVSFSKYKHQFVKGYTPKWTTEIFKIRTIRITNPATYL